MTQASVDPKHRPGLQATPNGTDLSFGHLNYPKWSGATIFVPGYRENQSHQTAQKSCLRLKFTKPHGKIADLGQRFVKTCGPRFALYCGTKSRPRLSLTDLQLPVMCLDTITDRIRTSQWKSPGTGESGLFYGRYNPCAACDFIRGHPSNLQIV